MVTIDDDIANRAVDFIQRMKKANKPFFGWVNFTHMHFRTHTKPKSVGPSGRDDKNSNSEGAYRVPAMFGDAPRSRSTHGGRGFNELREIRFR
jgi:hypothetical protein